MKINNKYEILTPDGFVNFAGIQVITKSELFIITCDNDYKIKCSSNHRISTNFGWGLAKDFNKGDFIYSNIGEVQILDIKIIIEDVKLYDLIDVEGDSSYYTNGIISHNCNFLGSAGSLISSTVLARMVYQIPVFSQENLKIYEAPQPEHTYAITVDPSEGLGLDYSVFVVTDVSEIPYRQVAIYRNDKIDPHVLPDIVYDIGKKYNDAFVLVEANNNGVIVCDILHETLEYDNLIQSATMGRAGQVAASGGFGVKTRIGVKTTPQSKRIGCSVCKSLIESDQYIVNDFDTLKEFTTFVQHLNTYQAEEGYNDDTVMCVVLFGWLINQPYFKEILHNSDIRKKLTEDSHLSQLLESVIPFGHIDDGTKQKENFDYNIPPDERDECAWIECGPWDRLQNSGFYK